MNVEFLDETLQSVKTLESYFEANFQKKKWKYNYRIGEVFDLTYFDGTPGDWFAEGDSIFVSGMGTYLDKEDVIKVYVLLVDKERHTVTTSTIDCFSFAFERKKAGGYTDKSTAFAIDQKVMKACAKKLMARASSIKDPGKIVGFLDKESFEDYKRQEEIDKR